jgi:hypothetical protein
LVLHSGRLTACEENKPTEEAITRCSCPELELELEPELECVKHGELRESFNGGELLLLRATGTASQEVGTPAR